MLAFKEGGKIIQRNVVPHIRDHLYDCRSHRFGDDDLPTDADATLVVIMSSVTLSAESVVTTTNIMTPATGSHITPGNVGLTFNNANFYGLPASFSLADRPSLQRNNEFPIPDTFRFPENI